MIKKLTAQTIKVDQGNTTATIPQLTPMTPSTNQMKFLLQNNP